MVAIKALPMPDTRYPPQWVPIEFTCACGIKCRVDAEFKLGTIGGVPRFQHCSEDEGKSVPGEIIGAGTARGRQVGSDLQA